MTSSVVRSNTTTSAAEHISARLERCSSKRRTSGTMVCTMWDQACVSAATYLEQRGVPNTRRKTVQVNFVMRSARRGVLLHHLAHFISQISDTPLVQVLPQRGLDQVHLVKEAEHFCIGRMCLQRRHAVTDMSAGTYRNCRRSDFHSRESPCSWSVCTTSTT